MLGLAGHAVGAMREIAIAPAALVRHVGIARAQTLPRPPAPPIPAWLLPVLLRLSPPMPRTPTATAVCPLHYRLHDIILMLISITNPSFRDNQPTAAVNGNGSSLRKVLYECHGCESGASGGRWTRRDGSVDGTTGWRGRMGERMVWAREDSRVMERTREMKAMGETLRCRMVATRKGD